MIGKPSPTVSRVRRTTSTGNRIRFSAVPPHASVRRFVRGARNWLIRYPSDPITSIASYPARWANPVVRAKSETVRSTALADRALGLKGLMGAFVAEAETENG